MKKIILILCILFAYKAGSAQEVSFSKMYDKEYYENIRADVNSLKQGKTTMDSVKIHFAKRIDDFKDSLSKKSPLAFSTNSYKDAKKFTNSIRSNFVDSIEKYKNLYYYADNVDKVNRHIRGEIFKKDTIYKNKNQFRRYAYESIRFFENDTNHVKYFKNNTVNYSPTTRQMSLYTEAINDYFAAFRIGIGFQIKTNPVNDTTNVTDSAKKILRKDDLVGNLQNQAGGDFNINAAYPLFKNKKELAWINYRIYLFGNMGVSLSFLNKSTSNFLLNSDIGIRGSFYSNGFNEKITLFGDIKIAKYFGNSNYQKVITDANVNNPTSFWLAKTSFGLAFMDGYRISFDLYPPMGNSFIKENFPASISFTIRPTEKKD